MQNWRWAGVPFYLRTGKRLPQKVLRDRRAVPRRAVLDLRPRRRAAAQPAGHPAAAGGGHAARDDDQGPGPGGLRLSPTALDISFEKTFAPRYPDAYERLLMDAVRGNPTLFMRRDEVEAAWTWVEPILDAWAGRRDRRALSRRHMGPDGGDRADRARRPHLARGLGLGPRRRRPARLPVLVDHHGANPFGEVGVTRRVPCQRELGALTLLERAVRAGPDDLERPEQRGRRGGVQRGERRPRPIAGVALEGGDDRGHALLSECFRDPASN